MKNWTKIYAVIVFSIIAALYPEINLAQGLVNNGAYLVVTSGTSVYVDGSSGNYTSESSGIINTSGTTTLILEGNWVNNSSNTGFSTSGSTLELAGTTQSIAGNQASSFYIIDGNGTGTCSISQNITVTNTLDLGASQVFDMNGKTLTLSGAISGTGKIKGSSTSNLVIDGSGTFGTMYFDQTTPSTSNKLNNLTYNRSGVTFTIGNALQVSGTITPTAGTLATGDFLTLLSTASSTASIAQGSGTYISGNATVQRYIPAGTRRYRFLSSPVASATLNGLIDNIYITGNGGVGGFDVTTSNSPSAYRYDETVTTGNADNGWDPFTSPSDAMTSGRGYRILIRGDRSDAGRLNGSVTSQNAVTLDLTGAVNKGDISASFASYTSSGTAANDGWNLMGNPYPSNLDWNALYDAGDFSNVDPTMYQRDVVSGAYTNYNALSNSGTGSQIINSFAGFFVQFTGVPTATFKESRKTATAGPSYYKSKENELLIKFEYDTANSDLLLLKFVNNAKSTYDRMEDSRKLMNETMNLFSKSADNESLCTDLRNTSDLDAEYVVPLYVSGPNANYKLKFDGHSTFAANDLFLEDRFLDKKYAISQNPEYAFAITSDVKTKNDRFNIIFRKAEPNGLSDPISENKNFTLFPNPANENINLKLTSTHSGFYTYVVYDQLGNKLKNGDFEFSNQRLLTLNTESWSNGIYYIKLLSNNHSQTIKFIK